MTLESQQDHITYKKQGRSPETTKLDPLHSFAAPRKSSTTSTTKFLFVYGLESLQQQIQYPILQEKTPQDSPRDMVEGLLQVHKAHVDQLSKLPGP